MSEVLAVKCYLADLLYFEGGSIVRKEKKDAVNKVKDKFHAGIYRKPKLIWPRRL